MKFFNPPQAVFATVVTLIVASVVASFMVYLLSGIGIKQTLLEWQYRLLWRVLLDTDIRQDIRLNGWLALGYGCLVALILPVGLLCHVNRRTTSLYGAATFATDKDIRQSPSVTWGEECHGGVIVGKYKGKLLRYIQPDFIAMGASTRAGKGAGIVIPNLLDWRYSMVMLDPKREGYHLTSRFRQQVLGQAVYLFDPFGVQTHGFNPFHYIALAEEKGVSNLLGLAETLYVTEGVTGAEKHFNSAAQRLFVAYTELLWFLLHHDPDELKVHGVKPCFSVGTMLDLYYAIDPLNVISNRGEYLEKSADAQARYLITDACNKIQKYHELGDEPKSSLQQTFEGKLNVFTLPLCRKATDKNDFDLRDLRKKNITIYLGILAEEVDIAHTLLNLFFNFAIKVSLRENPDFVPENKQDVLILLDEFPAIGAMPYIKKAAGFMAGFKLKLLTVYQNLSQLNEIYGMEGAKSLMANHPCKVIYAVSELDDANKFSAQLGYTSPKAKSKSRHRHKGGLSQGESENEAQRALVLPQELGALKFEEQFILLKGEPPIKCQKALYYQDDYFMDKLMSLSPTLQKRAASRQTGLFTLLRKRACLSKEDLLSCGELTADHV